MAELSVAYQNFSWDYAVIEIGLNMDIITFNTLHGKNYSCKDINILKILRYRFRASIAICFCFDRKCVCLPSFTIHSSIATFSGSDWRSECEWVTNCACKFLKTFEELPEWRNSGREQMRELCKYEEWWRAEVWKSDALRAVTHRFM